MKFQYGIAALTQQVEALEAVVFQKPPSSVAHPGWKTKISVQFAGLERFSVTSDKSVPPANATIRFEFAMTEARSEKAEQVRSSSTARRRRVS
jgi:hypothetical protein